MLNLIQEMNNIPCFEGWSVKGLPRTLTSHWIFRNMWSVMDDLCWHSVKTTIDNGLDQYVDSNRD